MWPWVRKTWSIAVGRRSWGLHGHGRVPTGIHEDVAIDDKTGAFFASAGIGGRDADKDDFKSHVFSLFRSVVEARAIERQLQGGCQVRLETGPLSGRAPTRARYLQPSD